MRGDKNCFRAGIQRQFKKISAVHSKNGAAIGMEIANGFQLMREGIGCGDGRK